MNWLQRIQYNTWRRMGWLKGHYAEEVVLRCWKKDTVAYFYDNTIIRNPVFLDGMDEVIKQYLPLFAKHGIQLVRTTTDHLADIHIRVHNENIYADEAKRVEAKGSTYAPMPESGTHFTKAYIALSPNPHQIGNTEDVIDVGLHEMGHATFCNSQHSRWPYDVMGGTGKKVLSFQERDRNTFDMAYKNWRD